MRKYNHFMIKIAVLPFNPFQENTYVISDNTGECIIIDAGNYTPQENAALDKYITDNGLRPVMAVNTHGHVDHLLGVSYVKEKYSVPFAVHSDDLFLVESSKQHGTIYGFTVGEPPVSEIDLKGMDKLTFGESSFDIIHTPGHTPGHVNFYNKENNILLTGDTLFKESIGRTDLPGGDYSWIMKSILEKIMPLGGEVRFYPGHGPQSTLGHEALYNPFITEVLGGEVNF